MTNAVQPKIPVRKVSMKSVGMQVFKTTIFVLFTMLLIAGLKVFFGGDPSLITFRTVVTALSIAIPISIVTAIGIVLYERKNNSKDEG